MKKKLTILAALLAAVLLAGCGSTSAPEEPAEDPEEAELREEPVWVDDSDFTMPNLYLAGGEDPVDGLKCLAAENYGDGRYFRQDMTEDGMLTVYQKGGVQSWEETLSPEDNAAAAAAGLSETGDYTLTSVELNGEYSANLSYPVYIVSFTTGANEDTRSWKVFELDTDSGAFLYGLSSPIDAEAEMEAVAGRIFSLLHLAERNREDLPPEPEASAEDVPPEPEPPAEEGAPAPDADRNGEVASLAGYWYPDGDEGAMCFLLIDPEGNWAYYERTAGDPEAYEAGFGTIVPSAGEPNAYYAEDADQLGAIYFTFTSGEASQSGADTISWDNDSIRFRRAE